MVSRRAGSACPVRDDYVLSNLVVLKPNWVTTAIDRVLTDDSINRTKGILPHSELPRIWNTDEEGQSYEPYLYPIFLRLMERFELSYQIEAEAPGEYPKCSLIPQLLPHQPPENIPAWPKVPEKGQVHVEMVYHLNFVPAGIMSWFVVRTHRYTLNLHWRDGVLLEYQGHQAMVELNPMLRELRLLVRGVQPHNFFTILMNTIDVILSRFKGLHIERKVPCICHWQREAAEPCSRFYRYEDFVRRMQAGRYTIECPDTLVDVLVPILLYGIHISTEELVIADIKQGQLKLERKLEDLQKLDIILERLSQQSELIVRNFTRQWNLEMKKIEVECPNVFFLEPGSGSHSNPKNWVSQEYLLYLVCQHPPGPHQVGKGYSLRKAEDWWIKVSPWLNHLIKFLKFGVPLGKAIGSIYDAMDMDQIKNQIELMQAITEELPVTSSYDDMSRAVTISQLNPTQQAVGPALRALYSFLKQADPGEVWGDLHKTVTPDGNILWLCDAHRQQYEVKPLELNI